MMNMISTALAAQIDRASRNVRMFATANTASEDLGLARDGTRDLAVMKFK